MLGTNEEMPSIAVVSSVVRRVQVNDTTFYSTKNLFQAQELNIVACYCKSASVNSAVKI